MAEKMNMRIKSEHGPFDALLKSEPGDFDLEANFIQRETPMTRNCFAAKKLGSRIFQTPVLILLILTLLVPVSGYAKMYEEPKSSSLKDQSLALVERKVLPKIDIERLVAEDKKRDEDRQHPGPHRFAVTAEVSYTPSNSGVWQTLADGRLWRLQIQSPGAKSLNLGITRFEMPEGVKLWVYDPKRKQVEGPYTARHRSRLGSLWTPIIEGDEIVVEVFVPTGSVQPVIEITKVNQGYRGLAGVLGMSEGACQIDVICPDGDLWRKQIRAVNVYTINGTSACTGNLMNNTSLDRRPFILSANHCGVNSTNDGTVVTYWNFQSLNCGTHGPGSITDSQTGATLRANWASSDFLLFELSPFSPSQPIDPAFNVFYAGWDRTDTAPLETVEIHHPSADVKAISFSNTSPTQTAYLSDTTNPSGNHWRIIMSSGVLEHGSSGSCLFETTNGRCIGQLHGGDHDCPAAAHHDWYGRFAVSWTGGGTDSTRLSNWLDPVNTGTMLLDGDPHVTTADGTNYDFQGAGEYVVFRNPAGVEIQTRQTPVSTASVLGPNAHTGLTSCVSLNTAVAARVGKHRVSYEPNISGVPDPSGMQLRLDGVLTTLGLMGLDLGDGGRLTRTSAQGGLEIDFPDNSVLFVTPAWWGSQSKWFLNVDVVHTPTPAMDGATSDNTISAVSGRARTPSSGGIMGALVPGSWLPALPDGSSMGPIPSSLHQRYADLYQKFGDAWRVTDANSLFDYSSGTSTNTFTMHDWPKENPPCAIPETKPVQPASEAVAQRACRGVTDKNSHNNCVNDVVVTGNPEFAKVYLQSRRILAASTRTTVADDENPTQVGEWVTFTATVTPLSAKGTPTGTVQFTVDGSKAGAPVKIDMTGRATWETSRLKAGNHRVATSYIPSQGSVLLNSNSPEILHTVKRCLCEAERK